MITIEDLKDMEPGSIIAKGFVENSPDGVYMTNTRIGDKLLWIAKRGTIHDWAIYIHWEERGEQFVIDHGDKLRNGEYIRELVPCTDEAFKKYRY